jgi:hypothetical protein
VILRYLINCYALPAENAVLKNPIATLKKSAVDFYTSSFCKFRALIVGQNGSARQKILQTLAKLGCSRSGEIAAGIDALVTTNHLLCQHSPGTAGTLLPFSQPISNFLRGKCPARTERGAAGGSARWAALSALTEKLAWNFMPNGSPTRLPMLGKKSGAGLAIVGRLRRQ